MPEVAGAQEELQTPATHADRVRSSSAKVRALIAEATERSATFRDLISRIDASDGIVLVEEDTCPARLRACLAHRVTLAGDYRILFVYLDVSGRDIDLMALIGHELRHALEVFDEPSLRSDEAIKWFYLDPVRRASPTRRPETRASQETGDAVFHEVRRSRKADKR
jgi:hypothetical protein